MDHLKELLKEHHQDQDVATPRPPSVGCTTTPSWTGTRGIASFWEPPGWSSSRPTWLQSRRDLLPNRSSSSLTSGGKAQSNIVQSITDKRNCHNLCVAIRFKIVEKNSSQ